MPVFQSNPFRRTTSASSPLSERISTAYRTQMNRRPFLFFGLPFIGIIVAASFLLTPATALRYEKHDRKTRQLTQDETLELGLRGRAGDNGKAGYNPRRRVIQRGNEAEEYYVGRRAEGHNWLFVRLRSG